MGITQHVEHMGAPARQISDVHQVRKDRSLPPAKAEAFLKRLGDDAADDWVFRAREAQLPPTDLDRCWLFLGGRGAGKSHSTLGSRASI